MVADWAPRVETVGALLRARTVDAGGTEKGTFTETTRPTATQVHTLIEDWEARLTGMVPADAGLDPSVWGVAKAVVLYGVALDVEAGYYPEQIGTGRSPWPQLKEMWDTFWETWLGVLAAAGVSTDPGSGGADLPPPGPVWSFDEVPCRAPFAEWPLPYGIEREIHLW